MATACPSRDAHPWAAEREPPGELTAGVPGGGFGAQLPGLGLCR